MKKLAVAAVAAFVFSVGSASAADLPVKARPIVAPEPPAWDLAFGSAIASDYIFRGITQSNHSPSIATYFEPRYNINKDLQLYAGLGGASIDFANRAAAEVDIYGGIRPTFDKLSLDFGVWYYWYPNGTCYNTVPPGGSDCTVGLLPNGNSIKRDVSFVEGYAKFNYAVTDAFSVGGNFYYSPSFLNSGAPGEYLSGTAKYTFTAFANGVAPYISGEFGRQWLGTTNSFYGILGTSLAGGINYADYNTWNVGIGWTWKVFTVDLRYSDTNLSKGDCNAFTGDFTAGGTPAGPNASAINPGGNGSNWCGAAFVARLSADLTLNTNVK